MAHCQRFAPATRSLNRQCNSNNAQSLHGQTLGAVGVAGGEEERQAAYHEAMNAVFRLQLECHRHTQPHCSKKDATTKWAMIEMWPMLVRPVCSVNLSKLHTELCCATHPAADYRTHPATFVSYKTPRSCHCCYGSCTAHLHKLALHMQSPKGDICQSMQCSPVSQLENLCICLVGPSR